MLSTRTVLHIADLASRHGGGLRTTTRTSRVAFTTDLQDRDYTVPETQRENLHVNTIADVERGGDVELGVVETNRTS